ncbi:MAG: hypothetical protein KC561_20580, partial [Myxococcales bacterium]|nr:hypothetical protein [Myxococcales bacterium]
VGVNAVTREEHVDTGDSYASDLEWADATKDRLLGWGFTTLGAWSAVELFEDMPYTVVLDLAQANWETGTIPDYFSQSWADEVHRIVDERVSPLRDDPCLIGWFTDNELRWGHDWRSEEDLLTTYLALPPESPGRAIAEDHMGDPAGFVSAVAMQYFSVTDAALSEADPNHLNLGARISSLTASEEVVAAAGEFADVLSINFYDLNDLGLAVAEVYGPRLTFDDWLLSHHEVSGLPVLITEFSYRSAESENPNSWPPIYITTETQAERGQKYAEYAQRSFDSPYIIGHDWFLYYDQPVEGRFDGEDNNFGLLDISDNPHVDFVERVQAANRLAPHLADD